MSDAEDRSIAEFSTRLINRDIYKCIDLRNAISQKFSEKSKLVPDKNKVDATLSRIRTALQDWTDQQSTDRAPRILLDEGKRSPYKAKGESKGPADRINILTPDGALCDLRERSEVVKALEPFKFSRAYVASGDTDAKIK